MLDELKRNGSGYYDPTAYQAMKNIKEDEKMDLKRGDIYLCQRPGQEPTMYLNISAEGRTGMFASMVMLTDKENLLYGVQINCEGIRYASCDLVMYMKKEYLTDFVKCATADEMAEVDKMVADALGMAGNGENERYRAAVDEVNRLIKMNDDLQMKLEGAERKVSELKEEVSACMFSEKSLKVELEEAQKQIPVFPVEIEKQLMAAEVQRDLYKELYEKLLNEMIG